MEVVFQMIDHVTRSKEQNRAFFKCNFKPVQPGLQVNEVNLGKTTRYNQTSDQSYNGHSHKVWFSNTFRDNNREQRCPLKKGQGQQHYKNGSKNLSCYYCEGEHKIKDCVKCTKDRSKNKQRDSNVAKQYKNKLQDAIQKSGITINEASFTRMPKTA